MKYAKQPFHVFVNVSETDGVPVSIMEAMSFDILVIATAVGGTPKLIEEGKNGYLLDEDFSDTDLITRIRAFMNMSEGDYAVFRKSAHHKFEREYSAIPNYRKLIEHLSSIGGQNATSY